MIIRCTEVSGCINHVECDMDTTGRVNASTPAPNITADPTESPPIRSLRAERIAHTTPAIRTANSTTRVGAP